MGEVGDADQTIDCDELEAFAASCVAEAEGGDGWDLDGEPSGALALGDDGDEEEPGAAGAEAPPRSSAGRCDEDSNPEGTDSMVPKTSDIFMLARQQNFGVALKLLDKFSKLWLACDEDGHSLLHWAALVGNKDFASTALSKGVPVDAQAANHQTPLMWAALRGHVSMMRMLLEANANIQATDSLGATPLMIAIQHKQYEAMLLLMHRGREKLMEDADNNGCAAAHWAAYKGDLTGLKFLDYFGADLQKLDGSKMLPLHRATLACQAPVIEFLLEKRSDPTLRNSDDKSCLDIAEQQQDLFMKAVFKRLMRPKGGDVDVERGRGEASPKEKGARGLMTNVVKDRNLHKVFPTFWLVCVSLALFEYLMDLRAAAWSVAPTASLAFELGVPLSVGVFAYVALSDPGKVPARARGASGVEEVMRALDAPGERTVDISRLCTTTWVLKGLRTKYCTQTGACVEEFDHYCIWLNCAIGKRNHRGFVILAIVELCTQAAHLYLIWLLSTELVPYQKFGTWAFGVLTTFPLLFVVTVAHLFTAPWVAMLFLHQARLIMTNLTTNEMLNAPRYEHFWVVSPGGMTKQFRNPFNKGSMWKNCLDFWWTLKRSEAPLLEHGSADNCCCHERGV